MIGMLFFKSSLFTLLLLNKSLTFYLSTNLIFKFFAVPDKKGLDGMSVIVTMHH
jgi:hypothetical protein